MRSRVSSGMHRSMGLYLRFVTDSEDSGAVVSALQSSLESDYGRIRGATAYIYVRSLSSLPSEPDGMERILLPEFAST